MITSAKYWKNETEEEARSIKAVINGVSCLVPMDNENRHYQEILEWVAEGNTIEETD